MAVAFIFYCPRCNRPYSSLVSAVEAMDAVKFHVTEQHPDHDPNWHETDPEGLGETPKK